MGAYVSRRVHGVVAEGEVWKVAGLAAAKCIAVRPLEVASRLEEQPGKDASRARVPRMTKTPGASCRARNFLALSAWLTVMAFSRWFC
jgi:hypothetical protein